MPSIIRGIEKLIGSTSLQFPRFFYETGGSSRKEVLPALLIEQAWLFKSTIELMFTGLRCSFRRTGTSLVATEQPFNIVYAADRMKVAPMNLQTRKYGEVEREIRSSADIKEVAIQPVKADIAGSCKDSPQYLSSKRLLNKPLPFQVLRPNSPAGIKLLQGGIGKMIALST